MNKLKITFTAGVEYNDKLYISAIDLNGLFEYDLKEKTMKYICNFTKEKGYFALHRKGILVGHEAWFMPEFGDYIAVVNLVTFDIIYIKAPYKKYNSKCEVNVKYYSGGLIDNKYIYFVPTAVDTLVVINLETKNVEEYYIENKFETCFLFGYYKQGKIILLPYNSNKLIEVNLNDHSIVERKYPFQKNYFTGVFYDNEQKKLWHAPGKSNYILFEDETSGENKKIEIDRGDIGDAVMTNWVVPYGDSLFFCGWETDVIIRLSKDNSYLKYYKLNRTQKYKLYRTLESEHYLILGEEGNAVFILNKENDTFEQYNMEIAIDVFAAQLRKIDLKPESVFGTSIYKEGFYNLDYFIEKCLYKYKGEYSDSIGKGIWESLS